MLHVAVGCHLMTTDVTSCSRLLQLAVGCCKLQWDVTRCSRMLSIVVWCYLLLYVRCMSSFDIVSHIVLLIAVVCWCSLVLLDASCDWRLSLGDCRCYKLQWVVVSCSERLKVVVGWCVLWCDAACGWCCHLMASDVTRCSGLLQVAVRFYML